MSDLDLWPEATRAKMKAEFAESIKQDYPEFAARLMNPRAMRSAVTGNLPQKVNWLKDLTANKTFLAVTLTAAERRQIIDQVEETSFDAPVLGMRFQSFPEFSANP